MSGALFDIHHVGARGLAMQAGVTGSAAFGGPLDCYRYRLTRAWDETKGLVLFIMMNPSVADPMVDDRTIAKCCGFARRWGYGRLHVGNTFAYRATDQKRLSEVDDPIGPENDWHLTQMAKEAQLVVFAYGSPKIPKLRPRGRYVVEMIAALGVVPHMLRLSKDGTPWHPLYLPDSTEPQLWRIR